MKLKFSFKGVMTKMYSPKIKDEYIPKLYHEAKRRKVPMTRLVNEIIAERSAEWPKPPEPKGKR